MTCPFVGNVGNLQSTGAGTRLPRETEALETCLQKRYFSNSSMHRHPWGLVTAQRGSHSGTSAPGHLGWGPRICFCVRFPGDAAGAGLGTTFGEPLAKRNAPWGKLEDSCGFLVPPGVITCMGSDPGTYFILLVCRAICLSLCCSQRSTRGLRVLSQY